MFAKFTWKHLCQSLLFNKVASLGQSLFFNKVIKKSLWDRCFSVNFAKLLRTTIFIKHLWWLLLRSSKCASALLAFAEAAVLRCSIFGKIFVSIVVGSLRLKCFYKPETLTHMFSLELFIIFQQSFFLKNISRWLLQIWSYTLLIFKLLKHSVLYLLLLN